MSPALKWEQPGNEVSDVPREICPKSIQTAKAKSRLKIWSVENCDDIRGCLLVKIREHGSVLGEKMMWIFGSKELSAEQTHRLKVCHLETTSVAAASKTEQSAWRDIKTQRLW